MSYAISHPLERFSGGTPYTAAPNDGVTWTVGAKCGGMSADQYNDMFRLMEKQINRLALEVTRLSESIRNLEARINTIERETHD